MKKFSFTEVMEMVAEAHKEEKKTIHVPHYYKRNGKILKRNYDDTIYRCKQPQILILTEMLIYVVRKNQTNDLRRI